MTGEVVGGMRCDDDGCFRTELQHPTAKTSGSGGRDSPPDENR